jgi:hypothetical protein
MLRVIFRIATGLQFELPNWIRIASVSSERLQPFIFDGRLFKLLTGLTSLGRYLEIDTRVARYQSLAKDSFWPRS